MWTELLKTFRVNGGGIYGDDLKCFVFEQNMQGRQRVNHNHVRPLSITAVGGPVAGPRDC